MKVIDLLNKIANGETDINNIYHFSSVDYCTINDFFTRYILDEETLNLEIEEEKEIPEKLDYFKSEEQLYNMSKIILFNDIVGKINEIKEILDNILLNCDTQEEKNKILDYITNLQEYAKRIEKANALLDEMLERAYIDGEYIMYDYSTSELLEVKQALQGEDKDVKDKR